MNRQEAKYYLRMRDGRNPYGSQGYVLSDRARNSRDMRGGYDRNYRGYDSRGYDYRGSNSNYSQSDYARNNYDYEQGNQYDRGTRYPFNVEGEFGRYDGHYDPMHNREIFEHDMMDRNYRYDRNYDYEGRGRNDYGDYGETLSREELKKWDKKLMKELEPKDKNMFSKEMVTQKAKQMGVKMDEFTEEELFTATLMMYTDYCKALKPFVGSNIDIYVVMAKEFLTDPDASVKGGEKLAIYYDCIVKGEKEEDDD